MDRKKDTSQEAAQEPFLELLRELNQTYQSYLTCSGRNIRSMGLTVPQFDVLVALGHTQGMTLGVLAEQTLITKSSLTGIVDRLEKKGMVRRVTMKEDRRRVKAVLTSKGEALFEDVFPQHVLHMKGFFDGMDEAEQAQSKAMLRRLRQIFEDDDVDA